MSACLQTSVLLLCACAVPLARADDDYYAPQTFTQRASAMFLPLETPWRSSQGDPDTAPSGRQLFVARDSSVAGTTVWRDDPPRQDYQRGDARPLPWRDPPVSKEQQAAILHHKQSLSSEGAFRFEYSSDNGLAAGEAIEPDGSRVGGYQYKDPSGRLVRLKYRAGKDGFQILEGSHLPQSPQPVAPAKDDGYSGQAYEQQRQQYELQQQQHNQQPRPRWFAQEGVRPEGAEQQYLSWRAEGRDDGQYRANELEEQSRGPHSFGEGYAFAFKG